MRPLRLVLEGIGPFARRIDIDFERFDSRSLFLVHGPTGSGKSFIFDAICYALYAQTPAGREANLRSDFLDDGTVPFIDFRFAIGNIQYRVHRELPFQRPKKRGDGFTTTPERQELFRFSSSENENQLGRPADGLSLATKKSDVDRVLRELLGLNLGQFRQVVMIPQGDFRDLLLSGSDDREKLLERLFDADFFKSLQEEFLKIEEDSRDTLQRAQNHSQALNDEADSLLTTLEETLGENRAAEELGEGDVPGDTSGSGEPAEPVDLGLRRRNLEPAVNELRKRWEAAGESSHAASQKVERAQLLLEDYRKLESLNIERAEQEKGSEEINRRRDSLVLADSAAEITYLYKEREAALEKLKESGKAVKELETELESIEKVTQDLELQELRRPELETRLAKLERWVSVFGSRRNEAAERKTIQSELEEVKKDKSEALKESERVSEERNIAKIRLTELEQKLKTLEEQGSGENRGRRIADLERLLERLEDFEETLNQKEHAAAEFTKMQSRENTLSAEFIRIRQLREENLAGELAAELKPNKPCPVCGSTHHPHPARWREENVFSESERDSESDSKLDSKSDFKKAEHDFHKASLITAGVKERVRSLEALYLEKQRSIQQLMEELNLQLEVGASIPDVKRADENRPNVKARPDDSAAKIINTIGELKQLSVREQSYRKERDSLTNETLALLDERSVQITERLSGLSSEIKRLESLFSERSGRWDSLIREHFPQDSPPTPDELPFYLDSWLQEKKDLKAQLDSLGQQIRQAGEELSSRRAALENGRVNLSNAESSWKKRCEDFESALLQRGFGDENAYLAARMPGEKRASERTALVDYDRAVAENTVRRNDLQNRVAERPFPNIDQLLSASRAAVEELRQLGGQLALVTTRLERLDAILLELRDEEESIKAQDIEHALLRKLSRQIRGVDAPKISLNRFFLARRLEEVLIQATRRLSLLSNDRFTLKRREGSKHAGYQAGLDLMVADAWTGTVRPVNTLSGGQLFMAALSLALGLADVVQARSGGIKIETLFIDEGFGTLDDEALQAVLDVLNDLRSDRMVGVISHVGELRRQIGNRIEVSTVNEGSTARLIPG